MSWRPSYYSSYLGVRSSEAEENLSRDEPFRWETTRWSLVLLSAQMQALGFQSARGKLYRFPR
jgi:hypothetical protein